MGWCIGRTEAMTDPVGARRKALSKLRLLEDLEDPESLVVPILIALVVYMLLHAAINGMLRMVAQRKTTI